MVKVGVFEYDKVFDSSAIPKATTLFKMVESKAIMEQPAEFNKILVDLENIEVHLEDKDKTILLLCAIPRSFKSFKDIMLYGKQGTITLEEVRASLRTKELTKSKDLRADENGEGLSVSKGNSGGRGNQGKSGNKSRWDTSRRIV